jgi:hypothetical protein
VPLNGYMTQNQVLHKGGNALPMCIGIDGQPSGGKTELALSAPGNIVCVTIDRGHVGLMLNPNPPKTRNKNVYWKVLEPPMPTAAAQTDFTAFWQLVRTESYAAVGHKEVRSVVFDGDSDSWEIQRMAEFGKLTQIPSHLYTTVNAARRAFYSRLKDSGKFVVLTSKMTKEYKTVYGPNGQPELNDKGQPKRQWTGQWERKGFDDLDYSLEMSLHCYRADAKYDDTGVFLVSGGEFRARLDLCKSDRSLEGSEFGGEDCNLPVILRTVYPQIPLKEWGY